MPLAVSLRRRIVWKLDEVDSTRPNRRFHRKSGAWWTMTEPRNANILKRVDRTETGLSESQPCREWEPSSPRSTGTSPERQRSWVLCDNPSWIAKRKGQQVATSKNPSRAGRHRVTQVKGRMKRARSSRSELDDRPGRKMACFEIRSTPGGGGLMTEVVRRRCCCWTLSGSDGVRAVPRWRWRGRVCRA